jgi:hypothetical protein
MAKKKGNAGSKKPAAKAKSRASAKAQKNRVARDAAATKAVVDAEAVREADEKLAAEAQSSPPAEEALANQAPEVDEPTEEPAPKPKRKQGRQKGDATPKAEIERQENIKEAMEYRLMGYTYRQIAEEMNVAPSTAHKWVAAGLADIPRETAEELRTMMMEQCNTIMQKLMPLMDETAPKDILDGILKVQSQQMKLAGMLQGNGFLLSY